MKRRPHGCYKKQLQAAQNENYLEEALSLGRRPIA